MKRLLPASEFRKNVLTLLTGTSIAQMIPLALSPVITRLYSPEEFGVFALYAAASLIVGGIAAGHYELAITLPGDDGEALGLVVLGIGLAVVVSLLLLLLLLASGDLLVEVLGTPELGPYLLLIPVSILLTGVFQCLNYWFIRKKRFKVVATSQVVQATTTGSVQLGGGYRIPGPDGLVLGAIAGQLLAVACMFSFVFKDVHRQIASVTFRSVVEQARRYRKFPLLQAPSTLVGASASQMPVVLLGTFFGPAIVGLFSLSQRVVRTPIGLVGTSIGEVFRQKASEDYDTLGNSEEVFLSTLRALLLISSPVMFMFALLAPDLFAFVFGEPWRISGVYARILSPLFWLSFIVTPLSVMIFIAEKQEVSLLLQIYLIVSTIAALAIGHMHFGTPEASILGFTIAYSSKYLIELYCAYRFSKGLVRTGNE